MNIIHSILLGLIQGITEWLPISSEGQSMLFMMGFLGISPEDALSLAIFLHLGTTFAVILKFRSRFVDIVRLRSSYDSQLFKILLISTIATGITAIPLFFLIKAFTHGDAVMLLIGVMLIITGILLGTPGRRAPGYKQMEDMNVKEMVFLGLAQGLSILPGISRSGTTITFLLLDRMNQKDALEVSFLISVPAVLGAVTLSLLTSPSQLSLPLNDALLMISTSFIAGYATIDALLRFAERLNFSKFCMILGLLTITFALLPWIL